MKTPVFSLFSAGLCAAVIGLAAPVSSKAVNVVLSGTNNAALESWLNTNFSNITSLKSGDYSNFVNNPTQQADITAADVVIIGRILTSTAYGATGVAAAWNAIGAPVVSFTSYVTRPDGTRLNWESGPVIGTNPVTGSETTLTPAGAGAFGGSANSTVDWYDGTANFNASGTGTVGTGEVLATLNGSILSAHWAAGSQSAGGVTFAADRFLFNLQDASGLVLPNAAGQAALIKALDLYTPLTANPVPEPSATAAAGLAGLGLLITRRRKNRA